MAKVVQSQHQSPKLAEGEDTTDGGTAECGDAVDVDKLRDHLCEVLHGMSADLGNLLQSGTLDSFSSELFAAKIISADVNDSPDFKKIMREFETSMNFLSQAADLEEHCRGFLQALRKSGGSGGPTSKAAEKLEEDWSDVVLNELGIHFIKSSFQVADRSRSNPPDDGGDDNAHETDATAVADSDGSRSGGSWSSNAIIRDSSLAIASIGPYNQQHRYNHRTSDPYPSTDRPTNLPRDFSLPILSDSVIEESREQEMCSTGRSDLVSAQATIRKISDTHHIHTAKTKSEEHARLVKLEDEVGSLKNAVQTHQEVILCKLTSVSDAVSARTASESNRDTLFNIKLGMISEELTQMREKGSAKKEAMKKEYKDVIERSISDRDTTIRELKVTIAIMAVALVAVVVYFFYNLSVNRMPSYPGQACPLEH